MWRNAIRDSEPRVPEKSRSCFSDIAPLLFRNNILLRRNLWINKGGAIKNEVCLNKDIFFFERFSERIVLVSNYIQMNK